MQGRAASGWALVGLVGACGGLAFDDGSDVTTIISESEPQGDAGRDASRAPCPVPAICEIGTARCNGRVLERCIDPATGAGCVAPDWQSVQECASADYCVAERGGIARCVGPDPCSPGELSCSGPTLRVCNADLTGWEALDTCTSAAACDSGSGSCLPCLPGERRCDGNVLQRCNEGLTGWAVVEECASAALCSEPDGACLVPVCESGELRCDGARLQRCRDDQAAFETAEVCVSPDVCELSLDFARLGRGSPRCLHCSCQLGESRCLGGVLQVCDDACAFHNVEDCGAPELCNGAEGRCSPAPGADAGTP